MGDARDPEVTRTVQTEPTSDVPPLTRSATWGDLQLRSELGHGAYGRVYRAWDDSLAREVALKIIKPRDAAQRASMLLEGQMLARVSHRNVVTVYRAQQIGDEVGLTMELIKGRHLASIVEHDGAMGAEEASVIGLSLCQALAAVHGAGLLHRDVKAHNVMREAGGRIVLMDFGAGRQVSETQISDLSGTPLYLAPELFAGQAASPASDLYSLGVLLFYLVARKYPIEGRSLTEIMLRHKQGPRNVLSDLRPDLPPRFVQVINRALSPAPELRSRSAGAMLAELIDAMPGAARSRGETATLTISPAERLPGLAADRAAPSRGATAFEAWHRLPLVVRGLLVVAAVFTLVLAVGFFTTVHYDQAIGRTRDFTTEGLTTWLTFGFRALLPVTIYITGLVVIIYIVRAVWHFVQRLAPPARRLSDRARTSLSGSFGRIAGTDGASVAQFLLLAQVLSFGVVLWVYRKLFALLPFTVNELDAAKLDVLAPLDSNGILYSYVFVVSVILGAGTLCWILLRRSPLLWATVPTSTVVAAVALMALMFFFGTVPDRLFFMSEAPEVSYQGQRCFKTGEAADGRVLLYCPDRPAFDRIPIVESNTVAAGISTSGRIFSRPSAGVEK
ncbi:MAG: serine/threonine protein kinase [Acidobacteriota bacterium]